jgi:hypothetical protein
MAKAPVPVAAGRYRIRTGQTIYGLIWSNAVFNVFGKWMVIYDDGDKEMWPFGTTVTLSTRAPVALTTNQVAKKDGWVVDGYINGSGAAFPAQRGQAWTQAFIIDPTIVTEAVDSLLCGGYLYTGHPVPLGAFVEPGPAGGHGMLRVGFSGVDQAAGTFPVDYVPVGAIWRLRGYEAVLVTDATVGNRGFALLIDDGTAANREFGANNTNTQAATLTRTWAWWIGTEGTGTSFTDTQVLLPAYNLKNDILMFGGITRIRLASTGTLAFTATDDFGPPTLFVEEWVMPN